MPRPWRFALLASAFIALGALEAAAQANRSGSVPLSVLTPSGRVHNTTVMWRANERELVVTNVTSHVDASDVPDLFDTLRMQLARATAISLRPATAKRQCCATMSGSGVGFAGNVRANLHIEQRLEGPDRVVQTVVIRGYNGPPLDGYTARLLFQ
ncbi:MAG: hypothetical protein KF889_07910 [Alphaproteobacteria bacterium]|nr:hypothetical protein [Alphaproteobacteria bacterium]MCW5740744.1 hypothetical protein [Alphaproteobacteria bacterium]